MRPLKSKCILWQLVLSAEMQLFTTKQLYQSLLYFVSKTKSSVALRSKGAALLGPQSVPVSVGQGLTLAYEAFACEYATVVPVMFLLHCS